MNLEQTLVRHLNIVRDVIICGDYDAAEEEKTADMLAALVVYAAQKGLDTAGMRQRYFSSVERYRAEFAIVVKSTHEEQA